MFQNGTWMPYEGSAALILAAVLLVLAAVLAFLGSRLHDPIGVRRPGKFVGTMLVVMWFLALATYLVAVGTYYAAFVQYHGEAAARTIPKNPVSPVTFLAGVAAFLVIAIITRKQGWKTALGSAIVGTISAPMIFELPFDLITMFRTFPPEPATQYTLLFFLPLFVVEMASFCLLSLSPAMKLSRFTLFSLAGMFLVFAIWALFGFHYPTTAIPTALNMMSKVLSFVAAITLFLPAREAASL